MRETASCGHAILIECVCLPHLDNPIMHEVPYFVVLPRGFILVWCLQCDPQGLNGHLAKWSAAAAILPNGSPVSSTLDVVLASQAETRYLCGATSGHFLELFMYLLM